MSKHLGETPLAFLAPPLLKPTPGRDVALKRLDHPGDI
jgi:hypothetical protein